MKILFHRGAPCTPPVVNGVTFKEAIEHPGYFFAEIEDEVAKKFEAIKTFFEHPDHDPAKKASEPSAEDGDDAVLAENIDLKAENAKLKEQIVDLTAKVDTVTTENEALREQIAELEAEEEAGEDDTEILKSQIAELETKKTAGQTSKAENMKLGKLKKKLESIQNK